MRFCAIRLHYLLLVMAAGIISAAGNARAQAPACGSQTSPSCGCGNKGGDCPSCSDTATAELVNGPGSGDNQYGYSPFDLGEGAPAQSGSSFAVNMSPNMIGDLLSNGGYACTFSSVNESVFCQPIPIAGGDRRFKISENMSPVPRDRVFYAFNGFQQAARTIQDREIDVNRHTLGVEKTFWAGDASVEVRMPILQGLNAVQTDDNNPLNDDGVEFGNLTIIPKFIIDSDESSYVFSWGIGINLPTARNSSFATTGNPFLGVNNEAVHLSPFLGWLLLPNDKCYLISYVQADFDTNGNAVTGGRGTFLGRFQDQNLLQLDVAVGHYLYRDDQTRLTGVAAQFELHYTTTLQDTDRVSGAGQIVTNPFNRLDLLIFTTGVNFQFGERSWLTVGCAVPLRGEYQDSDTGLHPERPFDAEIQVLFNRYY